MTPQYVRTHGATLFCREYPGGAPPVVLLPGLTVSGGFFESIVGAGLSPRFRTLALDLRGRGRSDSPPGGHGTHAPTQNYTMCDHAVDVFGALDALGVHRPVLVGHSFGGMLALYLAACAPDRFERVVVLDAAASLASPGTRDLLKPTLDRLDQVKPSWEEYLAALKRLPYFDGWWDAGIEAYFRDDAWIDRDGRVRARARSDAIRSAFEGLLAVDWSAVLSKIRQPVLLVNATGSFGPVGAPPFLSKGAALSTVEALKNARYAAVPGNHLTMAFGTNAEAVVRTIGPFIAGQTEQTEPEIEDETDADEVGASCRCRQAARGELPAVAAVGQASL